jgi:deazaflavin-dependent oxidoreductase (nitroreductase family)
VANLRAHPDARVLVGRDERAVHARETDGAERDRLWSLAARGYPGYELYATWTQRKIPVISLEPVEA